MTKDDSCFDDTYLQHCELNIELIYKLNKVGIQNFTKPFTDEEVELCIKWKQRSRQMCLVYVLNIWKLQEELSYLNQETLIMVYYEPGTLQNTSVVVYLRLYQKVEKIPLY